MKALTVREPYASQIVAGTKRVEWRSWAPRLEPGDWFALHIAKRGNPPLGGCIVAVVEYLGVRPDGGWRLGRVRRVKPARVGGQLGLWAVPPAVERRLRRA